MKTLGFVVSDKNIFENCILKTYFVISWPTYATNWNGLNNFDRRPTRDHSYEVWSKSNKRFQRRCCLKIVKERTHARTDDGRRKEHKSSLSTSCLGELKSIKGPVLAYQWNCMGISRTTVCAFHSTTLLAKRASLVSIALKFNPRRAGLGRQWHYILCLNTPVWAPMALHFEPKYIDMVYQCHYNISGNKPVFASHGTKIWA